MAYKKQQPRPVYPSQPIDLENLVLSERAGVEINLEYLIFGQIAAINRCVSSGRGNMTGAVDMLESLLRGYIERDPISSEKLKTLEKNFKIACQNSENSSGKIPVAKKHELLYARAKMKYDILIDIAFNTGIMPASKLEITDGDVFTER